jgi:hypothetical protein
MTSRERPNAAGDGLGDLLRTALKDGFRAVTPSAGGREALLRAAAERQRALRPSAFEQARHGRDDEWRPWEARTATESPTAALLLHARLIALRIVQ